MSLPNIPILILGRFNGYETYPVVLAEWNIYWDADLQMMNLWISIHAGNAITQQEDSKFIDAEPWWELNLLEPDLTEDLIKAGFYAKISEFHDDSSGGTISSFYYCSYNGTENNTIAVMEVDGERVRFMLYGETTDINYYDGSKPPTKLTADLWFERNRSGMRSMA